MKDTPKPPVDKTEAELACCAAAEEVKKDKRLTDPAVIHYRLKQIEEDLGIRFDTAQIAKALSVLVLFVCLSFSAHAQTPTYASQTLGTFTAAASTATNVAYVIDCRKQSSVMLQLEAATDAATAVAHTLSITRSVDGTTYQTAPFPVTLSLTGVTKQCAVTNLPTFGCGYMKINWSTNDHATTIVTNAVLRYAVKINAP